MAIQLQVQSKVRDLSEVYAVNGANKQLSLPVTTCILPSPSSNYRRLESISSGTKRLAFHRMTSPN